jgi:hypothetical protein
MGDIINECKQLMNKYGHLSFVESLPALQNGWWTIGNKHDLTGPQVLNIYLAWRGEENK